MNVLIALALLIWLLSRCGKKRTASTHTAQKEAPPDEFDWIDELELLDAATDDFI